MRILTVEYRMSKSILLIGFAFRMKMNCYWMIVGLSLIFLTIITYVVISAEASDSDRMKYNKAYINLHQHI